jgi:hypothetical protein
MSDPVFDRFQQLTRLAATEPVIHVDVADRVLNSLRELRPAPLSERTILTFFATSLTAAAVALAVVFIESRSELPVDFIQPFVSTMP